RPSRAGKSPAAPEEFWSSATGKGSIIDPCAGDSAWIGWDRPCAFFSRDPSCPASKRPANAALRHRLALVPTEPVPPAFECARAEKNLRVKYWKASRTTDAEWPPAQFRNAFDAATTKSKSTLSYRHSVMTSRDPITGLYLFNVIL